MENLRREFVWFDRLEVLEAERNHYTKLAREAEGSKASPKAGLGKILMKCI